MRKTVRAILPFPVVFKPHEGPPSTDRNSLETLSASVYHF